MKTRMRLPKFLCYSDEVNQDYIIRCVKMSKAEIKRHQEAQKREIFHTSQDGTMFSDKHFWIDPQGYIRQRRKIKDSARAMVENIPFNEVHKVVGVLREM